MVILAQMQVPAVPQAEPQTERRRLDPKAHASMIDIVPQGIAKWDSEDVGRPDARS